MKVSLNWLKELVTLPEGPNAVDTLSDLLTKAGVEVEGVEHQGVSIDKVVVAQVLESTQHPNADRLSVCRVDDGSGSPRQIVCGAKNYKVGDKVPLALPGAVMPGDFKIKVGKLRGVESEGMMCSAKELGLPEGADGLLILPAESVTGTPISELFPADTILDLEVTPNRPDLLSHTGMAREIATLLKQPLRLPAALESLPLAESVAAELVAPEAKHACPFYTVRRISGVTVAPSPEWLRAKLEAVGLRAINNVVDITNYVMLELGQPLHAFDAAKVSGGIRLRLAAEGEKIVALDGKTYALTARQLVIADSAAPLAIAGVMGGQESGVSDATTDLLLESAWFTPAEVRKTSRELNLSSDSSYRFERGVDPELALRASARAVQLILEVAGGKADTNVSTSGTPAPGARTVPFRLERCHAVLGAKVPQEQVEQILTGFGLTKVDGGWVAPSFRQDLAREIDLIEEIARVIGIEAIPSRFQSRFFNSSTADKQHDQASKLRRTLAAQGFNEARSLTLISEKAQAAFPSNAVLRVKNPLNEEQVILRPSLIPGLLGAVAHNIRNGSRTLRLFELGRVFSAKTAASDREEHTSVALVITGTVQAPSWKDAKPLAADIFDLKGALAALNLGELTFTPAAAGHPALALTLEIQRAGKTIGLAGQLLPAQARELDATSPVLVAELDLDSLHAAPADKRFTELPKYPAVTRDVAVIAPLEVAHGAVEATLLGAGEPLLAGVELFDLFTDASGEKIPADKKSLAYALTYRSLERTLTAEEVTQAHTRLKDQLKAELAVTFRE
jgi:phenylalanyl-tRNA synthetase beta chain